MTTLCINPQCPSPENQDDRDRCLACGARLRLGDRFRPVKQLGAGGFGRTFLAWDEASNPPQRCVVKQLLRSRGSRQQDLAEAERLAQLGHHPQIPTLIAILESTRDLCLVQEYIPGQNLEQVLQTTGTLDEAAVRTLLLSLLPVVQFIHAQGVIHRDIKPENILLPNANAAPVLVDFGAARSIPTVTELQQTGTIIGSASYAAPEQVLGKAVPASDVYGLGITCLHLLTGLHPFDLYSVAEDRWVWEPFVSPPVSPDLARVLNRMTARSLRSRYPSAEAALTDLLPAGIRPTPDRSPPALLRTAIAWRRVQTWETPGRVANALALSPDGATLATANSDCSIQLWTVATGSVQHTWTQRWGWGQGHQDGVTAIAWSPDGRYLFTGSLDSTLKQWDSHTHRLLQTWHQSGWQVTAIALTSDAQYLISGAADGRISLWNVAQGRRLCDLVRHTAAVNDFALAPDDARLLSAGEDGTLRLWSLPAGHLIHTWIYSAPLRAVVLSAKEPCAVTGDAQGSVQQWDLITLDKKQPLAQHTDAVSAIALSPNGHWLATGSRDRTIHLWQWSDSPPQPVAHLQHDWAVRALEFAPDSQTLISSGADETIRFWQLATTTDD